MTWEAIWIFASAQSTSEPFIQIFPVPVKAINCSFRGRRPRAPEILLQLSAISYRLSAISYQLSAIRVDIPQSAIRSAIRSSQSELLALSTKGAPVGPRVQRLSALPAEPRRRRLACAQPRLNRVRIVARSRGGNARRGRPPGRRRHARGQHVGKQVRRAL